MSVESAASRTALLRLWMTSLWTAGLWWPAILWLVLGGLPDSSIRAQSFPAYPSSQAQSSFRDSETRVVEPVTGGARIHEHPSSRQPAPVVTAGFSDAQSVSPDVVTASLNEKIPAQPQTPLLPPKSRSEQTSPKSGGSLSAFLSMGSSLLVVLGLFLGLAWLYRKSVGNTAGGGLPKGVLQVLGRTTLAPRQQLVLLRFGSKLVLVSQLHGETRTISEIADPLEVDQLTGLCESSRPGSVSQSFREILSQGARS
jgi:flagellar biogenesis protein FliO